jgi:hypothetical protein
MTANTASRLAPIHAAWRVRRARWLPLVPFVLLWCYLIVQYQFVYPAHDDYGYASLSYGVEPSEVAGTDFTVGQLVAFLGAHYREINGRNFLFHVLLLSNLTAYRLVLATAVAGTYFFLARVARIRGLTGSTVLCASYAFFPHDVYRTGFYWFSAAGSYALPLVFLLGAVVLLMRLDPAAPQRWTLAAACGLLFAAGTFHEQLGLATVVFAGLAFAWRWWQTKTFPGWLLTAVLSAGAGASTTVLAPGSRARYTSTGARPPLENLKTLGRLLLEILYLRTTPFAIGVVLLTCLVAYVEYRRRRCPLVALVAVGVWSAVVALSSFGCGEPGKVRLACWVAYAALSQWLVLRYLIARGFQYLPWLIVGANTALVAVLLVAPGVSDRMTMFALMLFYATYASVFAREFTVRLVRPVAVVALAAWGATSLVGATGAYLDNRATHVEWDRLLRAAHDQARAHEGEALTLELPTFPQPGFVSDSPGYTMYWMREYYDIADSLEIVIPQQSFDIAAPRVR